MKDITEADVQALHKRISDGVKRGEWKYGGPGAANRTLALLSAIFRFAGRRADNPVAGVRRNAEVERERFLQVDELPRFFEAVQAEPPLLRDFFLLALWTGQRRANVQAMRWDEINETAGSWTIPASKFKTGQPLTVPLAPQALAILKERRNANAQRDEPSEWVLPSHRREAKTPHLTDPKAAWDRVCKRAKLADLRIHDLRRTLGSWQAATGASLSVIGKSLGHRKTQTTAIYARLSLDPVREAVNTATAAMEGTAKPDTAGANEGVRGEGGGQNT